jgi:hypothetical protein
VPKGAHNPWVLTPEFGIITGLAEINNLASYGPASGRG